jgi:hypothetical protein
VSVRSFQVPATPGTWAWPPSRPSVPTSRATRVTSPPNALSWSTMPLIVSLGSSISPLTLTVIFFDKSPLAIAVATSAMLRTWPVRLLAMKLTLSVRSFHVPATPGTIAWPPSVPSVPTSRATRVTSEVKIPSWRIIVFTIVADRRNSPSSGRPSTSRRTVCSRSPCATASSARVISAVGQIRSSTSVLTDDSICPQAPLARSNFSRWRMRPRRPTASLIRSNSDARRAFDATISLKVSAIFPSRPVQSPGRRTEKSPSRTACRARSRAGWGAIAASGRGLERSTSRTARR